MFENPRRGRQARNFATNVPKILVLKSSSEQIFSRKLPLSAPESLHLYNRFKCEAIVQGITTLVGRRLGKTLTIKLRVWDLAMFTNDTQDKKDARR